MSTELLEEREFLLQSIRDLDAEYAAGDLEESDYRTLRDDYTARAAEVLRRLDGGGDDDLVGLEDEPSGSRRRANGRTKAVAAALVLALVSGGAGFAIAGSSDERLATDEATGDIVEGSTDRITRAQVLASEGKILEAVRVYDDLLDDDPENPVALAQKGWLLSRVGEPSLVESGLASIDRSIALEPTYADAHFFRGMILWRAKDEPAMAAEAFQRGLDTSPPPELRSTFEEAKRLAEADAAAASGAPSATP